MTAIKQLPIGWATTTVGEVATYQNGRAFKPSEWGTAGLPIIRIQNLNDTNANYNFTDEQHEERFKVKSGDLLFAWSASLGAYIWQGQDAWLNQHIFRVDHLKMIDRLFLYYALTNITADLYAKAHGSGMVHVTKARFEETKISLPPLVEQRRIVAKIEELLSELDKGIESLKAARAKLDAYRQAVLKHAFEGKLTAQWREENKDNLETPEQLIARIKREREAHYEQQLAEWKKSVDEWEAIGKPSKKPSKPMMAKKLPPLTKAELTALPELPKGWRWVQYGTLTEIVRNGISRKPTGEKGEKISRISAVRPMNFNMDDYRYIDNHDVELDDYLLRKGDVVFTRYNGSRQFVGVCAEYRSDEKRVFPDKLIQTRVFSGTVSSSFIEKAAHSGASRRFIESRIRTTAGQSGVSGSDIKCLPIPLCPKAEQRAVVKLLESKLATIDRLETQIEENSRRVEALRQSILKKAFAGELVPQDPHDEPASVLLSRIRTEREKVTRKNQSTKTKKGRTPT